jgi:DNA polymerase-3 subunit delta'
MALNCPRRTAEGEPCGACESCERIWSGKTSLDVIEIDAASNRGVDDARDLRERAMYAPTDERRYKVYIIDEAHMLTREAWNALLKILEEPPKNALLLLVSHAPGQLVPTIRSRCRMLRLRPLAVADVAQAAAAALDTKPDDPDLQAAAQIAEGSVARALALMDDDARALRQDILDLLAALPEPNARQLHALGDALAGTEPRTLATFVDIINGWLASRLALEPRQPRRMARVAEAWEKINQAARDVDEYNLERKPFVFAVFGWLAEAARG